VLHNRIFYKNKKTPLKEVIFLSKGAAKQPIISAKRVWRTTLKNSLLGLSEQMQPPAPVSGHCHHKEPGALF
jgi:hypothetical protein